MLFQNQERLIANGATNSLKQKRADSLEILAAALQAVDPYTSVSHALHDTTLSIGDKPVDFSEYQHIYVVGFGKASVGMVRAASGHLSVHKGVVITNDASAQIQNDAISVYVGGHPLPNQGSVTGAQAILDLINQCSEQDILLVLISGGGSALLCHPRLPLDDLQKLTTLLLKCGADINEINTIRKHLSKVKGGQLLHQVTCPVLSFIISDIIDDPLEFIASGPTVADSTTFFDAYSVLQKYDIWKDVPSSVQQILQKGMNGDIEETLKASAFHQKKVSNTIVANNKRACTAAADKAKDLGYTPFILNTRLKGEAKELGPYLIKRIQQNKNQHNIVLIAGGESTVTIQGNGKGGRNQEMVLSAIETLSDMEDVVFSSFATDGIDGFSDAAGAIADSQSLRRAREKHLKPQVFLDNNDSFTFFSHLHDSIYTGPTGTNVMDIQVLIQ